MNPIIIDLFRKYVRKAPVIEGLNAPIAPLLPKLNIPPQENTKRRKLFERQKGLCAYCEEPLTLENGITLDHIQPKSRGGSNKAENLVLACRRCNGLKGNLHSYEEAIERIRHYTAFVEMLKDKGYLK